MEPTARSWAQNQGLIDQNLRGQVPDFPDGENVLVEGCFLGVLAASIWRWRYGSEKKGYLAGKAAAQHWAVPPRR
jgi:hypothetical protein